MAGMALLALHQLGRALARRQGGGRDGMETAAVDEAAEPDEAEADRLLTDLGAKV